MACEFKFQPDRTGYSVETLPQFTTVETMGGWPRTRRDLMDATNLITCTFTFTSPEHYAEFIAFYEEYKKAPYWFAIDLLTEIDMPEEQMRPHAAQIIPGTFRLNEYRGLKWVVAVQLEAYLNDVET